MQGRHPTAAMSRSNVVLTTIVVCLVTGAVSQQPQISVVNGNKVRQVGPLTSAVKVFTHAHLQPCIFAPLRCLSTLAQLVSAHDGSGPYVDWCDLSEQDFQFVFARRGAV